MVYLAQLLSHIDSSMPGHITKLHSCLDDNKALLIARYTNPRTLRRTKSQGTPLAWIEWVENR